MRLETAREGGRAGGWAEEEEESHSEDPLPFSGLCLGEPDARNMIERDPEGPRPFSPRRGRIELPSRRVFMRL